jgi:hypothetical protein
MFTLLNSLISVRAFLLRPALKRAERSQRDSRGRRSSLLRYRSRLVLHAPAAGTARLPHLLEREEAAQARDSVGADDGQADRPDPAQRSGVELDKSGVRHPADETKRTPGRYRAPGLRVFRDFQAVGAPHDHDPALDDERD